MDMMSMKVIKRNGSLEDVSFDKVLTRIQQTAQGLEVNPTLIAQRTLLRIYDGVKTAELDELAAQLSISLMTTNLDYGILASRIAISNHHRNTSDKFTDVVFALSHQTVDKTGEVISTVSDELVHLCKEHGDAINAKIDDQRDYLLDYFGFKTLEKLQYLLRDTKGKTLERPQHLMMRVSLALWGSTDLDRAFETYDLLSHKYFIHATPTNFNAGTPRQQLSSCFLLAMKGPDSIVGIYDTLKDCAMISKYAGGIGLHIHDIRAKGSLIRGTNGTSNGIVPMLRNFNDTARYVDQCFTPDTLVYTMNGPQPIEDIGVGEMVLTSDGTYQRVKIPIRHEHSGIMLEIRIKQGIYPIRVTHEHQIMALQGQTKGLNFEVIRNRLEKNIASPEFVDANKLKESDFVVFPIPTYVHDVEELSEEDCRFYGILLGDGHISTTTSGVSLNNTTKINTMEFVKSYLTERGIKLYEYDTDGCIRIKWSNASPRFKFTKSQLYDLEGNKKWDMNMLHLPLNKSLQIIRGLIETDGCIGSKEIMIELSSIGLIESMRYTLLRMGALTSGYTRNRVGHVSEYKNITTRLPTCVLRIPRIEEITDMFPNAPKGEYFTYLKHNNYMYTRVEDITEVKYDGIVHDFEIDGPHDYTVAHLGIAHNGGGKRNGSFAIYLEPWHADVEDFLKLKLNTGSEEERCRDLFYALWIPDLFMERVEANQPWTLFCPAEAPGLSDVYGDEFRALYTKYEQEGRGRKQVDAQKLWFKVLDSQIETGTPYLLYKDACNMKSNQKNLGTIKSSNLCTEIVEYSSPEEQAVCNLASVALPTYVNAKSRTFDFKKLREVVKIVIKNLNRVIDINFYPTPETKRSNTRHRPVGLGVQGLADVFALLRVPWESEKASELNQLIFEHIYYAAVESSCELAELEGPYETFQGSPMSQGIFQYDMWSVKPLTSEEGRIQWTAVSEEKDQTLPWDDLKARVKIGGVRNSLLLAPMPTASTSQILGFNECLTGDTLVSLPNGLAKRLDTFTNNAVSVNSYNESDNTITNDIQYEFMEKGKKPIHVITMMDGRQIKCTEDHKIIVKEKGWTKAGDIKEGDILVVSPIGTEDLSYSDEKGWILDTGIYSFHMETEIERNKILAFARILGYIRTDGSIQKDGKVTAVFGNNYDVKSFIDDCMTIYNDNTQYKITHTQTACIEVYIKGKLSKVIRSIGGMPHGRRVVQECGWPAFIIDDNCPKAVIREFLAGLFGGDGHSPCLIKTGNKYVFSRINISQTCCPEHTDHMISTMNQLGNLLKKFDINNTSIFTRTTPVGFGRETYQCGHTEHISVRLSLPPSVKTFDTFMTNIGIRYCSHKLYRFEIAASWARYIKSVMDQYNTIMTNAYTGSMTLKGKGRHVKSLQTAIDTFEKNNTLLNSHFSRPSIKLFYQFIKNQNTDNTIQTTQSLKLRYLMDAKQFLENTGTSHMFNNTLHENTVIYATDKNNNLPVYSMSVMGNKKSEILHDVYDINVNNTHTFIANGIAVHNCIEPVTSNIYTRRTLAGEFIVINRYLMADLKKLDLWNEMMKQQIIARNGSVQGIDLIPESIQKLYKTSWEIKQKTLIDMAAARGAFICQSQSLNLFVSDPNYAKLTSMHFYAWKKGLKTGLYYLRTRAPVMAQKFTIDPDLQKAAAKSEMNRVIKQQMSEQEECLMCGS